MNNYDDKIKKIKKRQKKLLEIAKENIEKNGKIYRNHAKVMVEILKQEDIKVKKYEAIVEAQKLVKKYTKEILESKDVEEIKKIREKLNKSINLIKKELKKREIDEDVYNKYCENAKNFRKSIAQDIRYLKRIEKIKEIKKLNNKINKLDKEDLKRLRKLVKNELEYGKKNIQKHKSESFLEKYDFSSEEPIEDNDLYVLQEEDLIDDDKVTIVLPELTKEVVEEKKPEIVLPTTNKEETPVAEFSAETLNILAKEPSKPEVKQYDSLEEYIEDKVNDYDKIYKIMKLDEYTGGVIKNIKIFKNNLPKLKSNMAISKKMAYESGRYHNSPELYGYSEYIRINNSVMNNIRKVMTSTKLQKKEQELETEHDRIIAWVMNYCKDKDISYQKSLMA